LCTFAPALREKRTELKRLLGDTGAVFV